MRDSEVAIIGAGPAGLAAHSVLGDMDCVTIEAGNSLQERDPTRTLLAAEGVGGAGLFSDGKLSYWPAATALWQLEKGRLGRAYDWLVGTLAEVDVYAPNEWHHTPAQPAGRSGIKRYLSVYATPEQRYALVRLLADAGPISTNERVLNITRVDRHWILETTKTTRRTRHLVLAMGRFGPLISSRYFQWPRYRRVEVGVRIIQPSSEFFLKDHKELDPKIILRATDGAFEWRTFCCCRDGEVIKTQVAGLASLSGKADCPPTGMSNVGFNVRMLRSAPPAMTRKYLQRLGSGVLQLTVSLPDAFQGPDLTNLFGVNAARALLEGLHELERYAGPSSLNNAVLAGPTIEGVGYYPDHDTHLVCKGHEAAWVAGDMAGSFRGVIAALVSGRLVGEEIRGRIVND